jgi:tryptophan synthase beta chain
MVLLHQSVIGLEAKRQMEKVDEYPDIVIGCAGGGSNLGGLMSAYMGDKLTGKKGPLFHCGRTRLLPLSDPAQICL